MSCDNTSLKDICLLVTYLFRTVAQVLGVSLSGALVQGVLLRELRSRITEPGSDEVRFSALNTQLWLTNAY